MQESPPAGDLLALARSGDGEAFRGLVGPYRHELQLHCRHVLIPTRANGQPAFGCYLRDPRTPILHAHGVLVLTLAGDRIAAVTRFVDNSLLATFGFSRSLRRADGQG